MLNARTHRQTGRLVHTGSLPCLVVLGLVIAEDAIAAAPFEFTTADDVNDAARDVVEQLSRSLTGTPQCPIHLVIDHDGVDLLGKNAVQQLNEALETAFKATDYGSPCVYISHDLTSPDAAAGNQEDLTELLKTTGPGSVLQASYFRAGSGMTLLARLSASDGRFFGFAGRIGLPVREAGVTETDRSAPAGPDQDLAVDTGDVDSQAEEGTDAATNESTLHIHGSSALRDHVMRDLATAYLRAQVETDDRGTIEIEEQNTPEGDLLLRLRDRPTARLQMIRIRGNGDNQGFDNLSTGRADIVMAHRPVTDQEQALFDDEHGVDMRDRAAEHVIGLDMLKFLVHRDNRLSRINRATLANVYSHQLEEWRREPLGASELTGPIRAIGPGAGYRVMDVLRARIMGDQLPIYEDSLNSGASVVDLVAADPNGIGFVGMGIEGDARSIDIDECGIIYRAEPFTVATEDHPLAMRLYLYVNPAVPKAARDAFMAFVMSDEPNAGQDIIAGRFVSLKEVDSDGLATLSRWRTVGQQEPEVATAHNLFREKIAEARRLSTTFRFRFDSDELALDSRGERDLERLVGEMQAQEMGAERLMLFGFADSAGPAAYNLKLAGRRAAAVAERLRAYDVNIERDNIIAIGEDAPVACNDLASGEPDELGRARNRRVEVWIKEG